MYELDMDTSMEARIRRAHMYSSKCAQMRSDKLAKKIEVSFNVALIILGAAILMFGRW